MTILLIHGMIWYGLWISGLGIPYWKDNALYVYCVGLWDNLDFNSKLAGRSMFHSDNGRRIFEEFRPILYPCVVLPRKSENLSISFPGSQLINDTHSKWDHHGITHFHISSSNGVGWTNGQEFANVLTCARQSLYGMIWDHTQWAMMARMCSIDQDTLGRGVSCLRPGFPLHRTFLDCL